MSQPPDSRPLKSCIDRGQCWCESAFAGGAAVGAAGRPDVTSRLTRCGSARRSASKPGAATPYLAGAVSVPHPSMHAIRKGSRCILVDSAAPGLAARVQRRTCRCIAVDGLRPPGARRCESVSLTMRINAEPTVVRAVHVPGGHAVWSKSTPAGFGARVHRPTPAHRGRAVCDQRPISNCGVAFDEDPIPSIRDSCNLLPAHRRANTYWSRCSTDPVRLHGDP